MSAIVAEEFIGLRIDTEHRRLQIDLTKPQTIPVIAFDGHGRPKEYFLKVTGRGLVLV